MYSRISALITVMLAAILSTTVQLVTAVQQTAANKNSSSLYQNSQYRFKIQYPSGWVVNSEPGNISLFHLTHLLTNLVNLYRTQNL